MADSFKSVLTLRTKTCQELLRSLCHGFFIERWNRCAFSPPPVWTLFGGK
ncbi:MAG: hypothetical protein OJF52_003805 [Nitrospira sp.]|nr:MAG: hypothetical protein OJF52_003805 [Nitrospira sp.]